jgi:hypothetical protein
MKRGDAMAAGLLWGSIIFMAIVISVWMSRNLYPVQADLSLIEEDIQALSRITTEACNSYTYERRYNPRVEGGNLTISSFDICISTQRNSMCSYSMCNLGLEQKIALGNLTYIVMAKDPDGTYDVYGR